MKLPETFHDMYLSAAGLAPMVDKGTYRGMDVEFTSKVEEYETYAEAGMRARIIDVMVDPHGDCVKILFNFDVWSDHNLPLETHNYYDKHGNASLTAREANCYHPQEWIYFEVKDSPSKYFNAVDGKNKYTVVYLEANTQIPRMSQFSTENLDETLSHIHHTILMVFRGWNERVR